MMKPGELGTHQKVTGKFVLQRFEKILSIFLSISLSYQTSLPRIPMGQYGYDRILICSPPCIIIQHCINFQFVNIFFSCMYHFINNVLKNWYNPHLPAIYSFFFFFGFHYLRYQLKPWGCGTNHAHIFTPYKEKNQMVKIQILEIEIRVKIKQFGWQK